MRTASTAKFWWCARIHGFARVLLTCCLLLLLLLLLPAPAAMHVRDSAMTLAASPERTSDSSGLVAALWQVSLKLSPSTVGGQVCYTRRTSASNDLLVDELATGAGELLSPT